MEKKVFKKVQLFLLSKNYKNIMNTLTHSNLISVIIKELKSLLFAEYQFESGQGHQINLSSN